MIENRELTMDDYLAMLRRRLKVILIPALLAPLVGFAISFAFSPKYTSTSLVLVEEQKVPEGYVKPAITAVVASGLAARATQRAAEGVPPLPTGIRVGVRLPISSGPTDRIVAVSHATAADLVRLSIVADERRLVVVPPGIDLEPLLAIPERADLGSSGVLRAQIGAAPGDFLAGVVGRLAEVKQPTVAVDVFDMLARRYPHLHLVFVGYGGLRGLLERRIGALEPDLARRVHLLGVREDMVACLSDFDAILLTSRSEGLPIALIEAAAASRPVVASDVGGVGEIVAHERMGFLGQGKDELAFGLARLLEEPHLGQAMGRRARVRVASRHSAEALADRLENLYRIVVEERACAS
jgi:glycosyltransferase involved in cell wall biosynthesis